MAKVLVIHGPNLNMLGEREPAVYGRVTLEEIDASLEKVAKEEGHELRILQSNHEGEIVEQIQKARGWAQALVINPAAYTHTSLAIGEAVAASGIPTVEVHLSNIHAREEFRHKSFVAPRAVGQIAGFGAESYGLALKAVRGILESRRSS
jgi:3-dehydroquinate dehydratase-2